MLTLLVITALSALFYMPRYSLFGHELRRVNLLSEVQRRTVNRNIPVEARTDSADTSADDSVLVAPHVQLAYTDSIPEGMVAIEDYGEQMAHFYAALSETGERLVRIAYFGDSYIEGDILTAHLRDQLQAVFGGLGVGFVDIDSETSGFRTTVASKAKGWMHHNANDERSLGFRRELQGINGRYYIPNGTATAELRCTPGHIGARLGKAEQATVYYTPGPGLQLTAALNDGESQLLYGEPPSETPDEQMEIPDEPSTANSGQAALDTLTDSSSTTAHTLAHHTLQGDIRRFRISVTSGESSRFYGMALDGLTGIALDNYSMRASNGWKLAEIPEDMLKAFALQRPYDLIILHYGLNTANTEQTDYSGYTRRMKRSIEHLRQAFPEASFLIVSVADRDEKDEDGEWHTMQGIRQLVHYQRQMAADTRVAFWNLYAAMGGDGAVADMVARRQANLDYTHINFLGGKHLASLLFDVLINSKENYDRRISQ